MSKLKEKFENSKLYQEHIQILTLSLFSKHRTVEIFGATDYMVKKSMTVKKEKGILGLPEKRKGHPLSDELKEAVYAFYENDDNSRACPGAKDCQFKQKWHQRTAPKKTHSVKFERTACRMEKGIPP